MRLARVTAFATALAAFAALTLSVLETAGAASIRAATVTPTQSNVSSNWAGYVVSGTDAATVFPTSFSNVSGTWVEPKADCSATSSTGPTSSAFWVGLGGDANSSNSLEQTGTEADCGSRGASYFAWYELVPAGSVRIKLTVSPGDKMSASVGVAGDEVTIHMANLTLGTSFSKTLRMAAPDTSSADWIAEAPSVCGDSGYRCSQVPLTDFGTVAFSNATATSGGHTGSINDSTWQESPVVLESGTGGGFGYGRFGQFAPEQGLSEALPSTLSTDGDGFTVTWHKLSAPQSQPSGGYGGYGGFGGGYGGYPGGGYPGGGSPGGGYGI